MDISGYFYFYFFIFILVILVLVGVAFFTLLERSILCYIQIRKGPNSVSFLGILQPFCDAINLFTKENVLPSVSILIPYYFSPVFNSFLSLAIWIIIPYFSYLFNYSLGLLFFYAVLDQMFMEL